MSQKDYHVNIYIVVALNKHTLASALYINIHNIITMQVPRVARYIFNEYHDSTSGNNYLRLSSDSPFHHHAKTFHHGVKENYVNYLIALEFVSFTIRGRKAFFLPFRFPRRRARDNLIFYKN